MLHIARLDRAPTLLESAIDFVMVLGYPDWQFWGKLALFIFLTHCVCATMEYFDC